MSATQLLNIQKSVPEGTPTDSPNGIAGRDVPRASIPKQPPGEEKLKEGIGGEETKEGGQYTTWIQSVLPSDPL